MVTKINLTSVENAQEIINALSEGIKNCKKTGTSVLFEGLGVKSEGLRLNTKTSEDGKHCIVLFDVKKDFSADELLVIEGGEKRLPAITEASKKIWSFLVRLVREWKAELEEEKKEKEKHLLTKDEIVRGVEGCQSIGSFSSHRGDQYRVEFDYDYEQEDMVLVSMYNSTIGKSVRSVELLKDDVEKIDEWLNNSAELVGIFGDGFYFDDYINDDEREVWRVAEELYKENDEVEIDICGRTCTIKYDRDDDGYAEFAKKGFSIYYGEEKIATLPHFDPCLPADIVCSIYEVWDDAKRELNWLADRMKDYVLNYFDEGGDYNDDDNFNDAVIGGAKEYGMSVEQAWELIDYSEIIRIIEEDDEWDDAKRELNYLTSLEEDAEEFRFLEEEGLTSKKNIARFLGYSDVIHYLDDDRHCCFIIEEGLDYYEGDEKTVVVEDIEEDFEKAVDTTYDFLVEKGYIKTDSPILDGADEIGEAIASGDFEKDKVIGRMIGEDGEVLDVIVNDKVFSNEFFISVMKDGEILRTWESPMTPGKSDLKWYATSVLGWLCRDERTYDKFEKLYNRISKRYDTYDMADDADKIILATGKLIKDAADQFKWFKDMQLGGFHYMEDDEGYAQYWLGKLKECGFEVAEPEEDMDSEKYFDKIRKSAMDLYYKLSAPMTGNMVFAEDMIYDYDAYNNVGFKLANSEDRSAEVYISPMRKMTVRYDEDLKKITGQFGEYSMDEGIREGESIDCTLIRLVNKFADMYAKYGDELKDFTEAHISTALDEYNLEDGFCDGYYDAFEKIFTGILIDGENEVEYSNLPLWLDLSQNELASVDDVFDDLNNPDSEIKVIKWGDGYKVSIKLTGELFYRWLSFSEYITGKLTIYSLMEAVHNICDQISESIMGEYGLERLKWDMNDFEERMEKGEKEFDVSDYMLDDQVNIDWEWVIENYDMGMILEYDEYEDKIVVI